MPQMPAYRSRYEDTIAGLLQRQGDIAAQGAVMSANAWAPAIQNIGAIAGQAVQDYSAQKQQQKQQEMEAKRGQLFNEIIGGWDGKDRKTLFMGLAQVGGPEWAAKVAPGVAAMFEEQQQPDKPTDPKNFAMMVRGMRGVIDKAGPQYVEQNWASLRSAFGKGAKELLGWEMPEQYTPELGQQVVQSIQQLDEAWNAPKAEGTKVVGDALVDTSGKVIYKAEEKPQKPLTEAIGGRIKQWNPETQKFDIDLGASEASLGREAALGKEERTRADKEEAAKQAANETRTQVKAAFAAMENRLSDVEKYSGSKAVTSPLESADARQQYLAAAEAFAATLSRATGDTRISDRDRRAYAQLLTYMGRGSHLLMATRPDLVRKRLEDAKATFKAASDVGLVGGTQGLVGSTAGAQNDPMGIRK